MFRYKRTIIKEHIMPGLKPTASVTNNVHSVRTKIEHFKYLLYFAHDSYAAQLSDLLFFLI
jgi:hypothetical protein